MISYTIAMPRPHTHRFHVSVDVDGLSGDTLTLALPVWTPGSYMVREYARHVQGFAASAGGPPLAWRKADKASWQIETGGAGQVHITYEVYAYELTVRTSHLDDTHGYFNPSTLCMYVPGRSEEPHRVVVQPPAGWRVTTGLRADPQLPGAFLARDYDELVDSPFECGEHRLLTFEVDGVPHEIALWGRGNEDEARLLADTRRIVEATRALFDGPLPYERYVFILHLTDGLYGGLEHRNSVSNQIDRWSFRQERAYERLLGLTSHEYYHVWNVKRIRPEPLGPFDYQRENYTRQLWVAEGITSYYDNLILVRAGLITPQRYLDVLAEDISTLQGQPGRQLQSLAQSSFDTWIKFYRPDENSANSSISYYLKGSLVALLLDLAIRAESGGARSLDDVMRHLYDEVYGGEDRPRFYDAPGFAEEGGFERALEAAVGAAGGRYRALVERGVATTEELDYVGALAPLGLALEWSGAEGGWLGLRTKVEQGRLRVASVRAGGPAEQAGIYAGDELLALDGFRLDEERLRARLAERRPGDRVAVTLFRGDRLVQVEALLAQPPLETLRLAFAADASDEQRALQQGWLGQI